MKVVISQDHICRIHLKLGKSATKSAKIQKKYIHYW